MSSSSIAAEVRTLASPFAGGRKKTDDDGEIEWGLLRFPVDLLHFLAAGPFREDVRRMDCAVGASLIFRRDHRSGFKSEEIR